MKPNPWSPSALNEFENCPKQYNEVRVLKRIKQEPFEASEWGNRVHDHFEGFFDGKPLPVELGIHEDYLRKIDEKPGFFFTEQKVAFDTKAQPCSWDIPVEQIWGRFKIDFVKVNMEAEVPIADVRDWKSGKKKEEFRQLLIYALHTFATHKVDLVDVRYYWLIDQTETRKVYARKEIPEMWSTLVPLLTQYRAAFRDDIWQPRQSGLCNGWCPVTDCEFWRPRRNKK